jgi:hypothetical protein
VVGTVELRFGTHDLTIAPYSDLGLAFLFGEQGHDDQCMVSWRKDFPLVAVPLRVLVFLDRVLNV